VWNRLRIPGDARAGSGLFLAFASVWAFELLSLGFAASSCGFKTLYFGRGFGLQRRYLYGLAVGPDGDHREIACAGLAGENVGGIDTDTDLHGRATGVVDRGGEATRSPTSMASRNRTRSTERVTT
jgi:hypothetical protein